MPTDVAVAVTPVFAAILVLLVVVLTLRVVYLRRKHHVGIGTGDNPQLAKAVRAHANAVETVPLALVVMLAAELAGAGHTLLLAAGSTLVVGRVLHAFGLSMHAGYSFGRFCGMVMTLAAIFFLAAAGLLAAL